MTGKIQVGAVLGCCAMLIVWPALGSPLAAGTEPNPPVMAVPAFPLLPLLPLDPPLDPPPQAARSRTLVVARAANTGAFRANFIDSPRCRGAPADRSPGFPPSRRSLRSRAIARRLPCSSRVQPGFGENHKNFPRPAGFPKRMVRAIAISEQKCHNLLSMLHYGVTSTRG